MSQDEYDARRIEFMARQMAGGGRVSVAVVSIGFFAVALWEAARVIAFGEASAALLGSLAFVASLVIQLGARSLAPLARECLRLRGELGRLRATSPPE